MFGLLRKLFLIIIVSHSIAAAPAHASIQDSDADGLTDTAEVNGYGTNPSMADTDGDGTDDGKEVLAGTNPLDAISSPLESWQRTESGLLPNPKSLPWYIGRSSGILAFLLFSLVVINGLLISTRLVFKLFPPALNYEAHRFLAWMALIATIGHAASFMFDHYFHLSAAETLLPFVLLRPITTPMGLSIGWTVGLGIIAFYGALTLVLSSEFRNRISTKTWRRLHYLSFVMYLLFLGHGVLSGTDSKEWWMISTYTTSGVIVFSLIIVRVFASIKQRRLKLETARPA
ncbi:MAG: ferric reductase-like transmembrane domain-containing protein [Candidatus Moraniibacteriota bacterium]